MVAGYIMLSLWLHSKIQPNEKKRRSVITGANSRKKKNIREMKSFFFFFSNSSSSPIRCRNLRYSAIRSSVVMFLQQSREMKFGIIRVVI